jgi:hypothetical protein
VTVVKTPTALVRERAAAPAAKASDAALHPGVAIDKAVAAASVVTFASPTSRMSELDREAVDGIARLAARERFELLVWARAGDASLMAEAQRRAAEIRTRALATGPLAEHQVVTRITSRPGTPSVDVVVSALGERAPPAGTAARAPSARTARALEAGEAGKRQLRETVQTAEASIEACVAELMERRGLTRIEGALRIAVSARGEVSTVTSAGDLAGASISDCLGAAARGWAFPRAEGAYAADVPVTVIRRR